MQKYICLCLWQPGISFNNYSWIQIVWVLVHSEPRRLFSFAYTGQSLKLYGSVNWQQIANKPRQNLPTPDFPIWVQKNWQEKEISSSHSFGQAGCNSDFQANLDVLVSLEVPGIYWSWHISVSSGLWLCNELLPVCTISPEGMPKNIHPTSLWGLKRKEDGRIGVWSSFLHSLYTWKGFLIPMASLPFFFDPPLPAAL